MFLKDRGLADTYTFMQVMMEVGLCSDSDRDQVSLRVGY